MSDSQALIEPEEIRLAGALDAWRASSVRDAFGRVGACQSVIVNLEGVTFIDSAGLGALIGGIRRIRNLDGSVVLCAPTRAVAKVFRMTGVDRLTTVAATRQEAVAALAL